MTAETVVSRLHAAVNAMPGPVPLERGLVLTLEDALTLDKLIATLCPEETACERCDTRLCPDCNIGDRTDGPDCPFVHCDDSATSCPTCVIAIRDDAASGGCG